MAKRYIYKVDIQYICFSRPKKMKKFLKLMKNKKGEDSPAYVPATCFSLSFLLGKHLSFWSVWISVEPGFYDSFHEIFVSGDRKAQLTLVLSSQSFEGIILSLSLAFSVLSLKSCMQAISCSCVLSCCAIRSKDNQTLVWQSWNRVRVLMCLLREETRKCTFPEFQWKELLIRLSC